MTEPRGPAPAELKAAVSALCRGQVVAFPTETYYGLAVDALDEAALARLFAVKGRAADKASALLVADRAMIDALCAFVPPKAEQLMAAFWPGPLTLVLPARPGLPAAIVDAGYVALRISPHPVAHALVAAFGRPITATSANLAGAAPARTADEVRAGLLPQSLFVLDGGPTPGGPPSTLVRVTQAGSQVLRRGAIDIR